MPRQTKNTSRNRYNYSYRIVLKCGCGVLWPTPFRFVLQYCYGVLWPMPVRLHFVSSQRRAEAICFHSDVFRCSNIHVYPKEALKTLSRTCFRGPRRRNWKWSSLIMLSSPRIPLFIRLNANCDRKISLWRSNNPLLTQVKMVMRKASRRLRTRPSTVSDGFAFVMDLRKKVTKESSEYWYMWSMRHLGVPESGHVTNIRFHHAWTEGVVMYAQGGRILILLELQTQTYRCTPALVAR